MVLTHKKIKKLKEKPLKFVESDPRRLHMSKSEVLKEKARKARIEYELEQERQKITDRVNKEFEDDVKEEKQEESKVLDEDVQKKIDSLQKQIDEASGPGSTNKKARLQREIDELKK